MPGRPPDAVPTWALLLLAFALMGGTLAVVMLTGEESAWEEHNPGSEGSPQAANAAPTVTESLDRAAGEASAVREGVNPRERSAAEGIESFTHEVTFGWVGIVVDEAGTPLAGLPIGWVMPWAIDEHETAITDVQGRFALSFDPETNWEERLRSGLAIRDAAWMPTVHACGPPASPPTEVRIVAQAASAWLKVQVVETDGKTPRANLEIGLFGGGCFSYARTDQEGRARLASKHGTRLELETFGSVFGWLSAPNPLVLQAGENPELRVVYEGTPVAIELAAHDRDNQARLKHAQWFGFESEGVMSKTPYPSEDGRLSWRLDEHGAIAGYCGLEVWAEGYLPTYFEWSSLPPEGELSVPLIPAKEVSVRLHLTRGAQPLAQAEVEFGWSMPYFSDLNVEEHPRGEMKLSAYSGTEVSATGKTNAQGMASIPMPWIHDEPIPKRVHLRVNQEDWWLDSTKLGEMPWHLDLEPAKATVQFRVVDFEGEAVSGVPIQVWMEGNDESPVLYAARTGYYETGNQARSRWAPADRKGESNEDGVCLISIPANTSFHWAASAQSRPQETHAGPAIPVGSEHEILVTWGGDSAVAGTLVNPDGTEWDGRSVAAQLLHLDGSHPTDPKIKRPYAWASAFTKWGTGKFRFEGVPPGQYRLHFHNISLEEDQLLVTAGQEDLVIKMQAMCRVHIEVADAMTGKLIPGESGAQVQGEFGNFTWSSLWNGKGSAEFAVSPDLSLTVDSDGYQSINIPLGDVLVPGTELNRRVELKRGRTVRLEITPPQAVHDGRFAGLVVRDAAGNEFTNYPVSYRTRQGEIFLLHAPREALQVWMLDRATREPIFKVDVAAAEGAPPAKATDAEISIVPVSWPEGS